MTADGNGAEFLDPPNFSLPRINLTSCLMQLSCHHAVSVRAGTKSTTVAPPPETFTICFRSPKPKSSSVWRIKPDGFSHRIF